MGSKSFGRGPSLPTEGSSRVAKERSEQEPWRPMPDRRGRRRRSGV